MAEPSRRNVIENQSTATDFHMIFSVVAFCDDRSFCGSGSLRD